MLLWILIALLTAAAIMAVLAPLGRERKTAEPTDKARDVYLDQLRELDRDRGEGRIDAAEAEAARAEIARRLLAATTSSIPTAGPSGRRVRRVVAVAALVGMPALALGLYLSLGAPNLPGQPLAARLSDPGEANSIDALIAKVEDHLARSPEDGRGWDVIAPVYQRHGRPRDAVRAYSNAIRILGSSAARQTGLGESILATEDGIVTEEAREAFQAALKDDPSAQAARFFLALAAEQEGKLNEAADGWRALLAEAPADAPWREAVEQSLARVAPGDDAVEQQARAVSDAAPDEQAAMIEGMVSRLAERLKSEPDDVEGWLRLIRSYAVLGRAEDAAEAGRAALAGIEAAAGRSRVEGLIADLGLPAAGAARQ